jgi:hypothetical protein
MLLKQRSLYISQGTSPEAQRLVQQIKVKLGVLQNDIEDAIQHQAITGGKKPNITFAGKRDQVQEWLHNPAGDPSGLGKISLRLVKHNITIRNKTSFIYHIG